MFRLTLEQGHSVATMLVVAAVALGLAFVFYRRCLGHLPTPRWRTLFGLRSLAIVLVVLLLFRPVFSLERELSQRRSLIVLLDTSTSMSTADDESGQSRFEQARARIVEWLGKLAKDFDLRVIAFSDRAAPLEKPGDVASLKPDGEATSLTRGLVSAARLVPARDVEAVVLFSDGIHNAAGDPAAVSRGLGLVVHTVGVGNSLKESPSYRDVQVAGLEVADQLPVNNQAQITARVRQAGLAGLVVRVQLREDDRPVDQQDLELKDSEAPQEAVFQYVPTVKGRHTYKVLIPAVPDEKIAQNNHRQAVVQVVDAHIRVLYVEGTLRAEYGAIVQRFLSKDPDIEFCALVQTRPNVFLQRTNMPKMDLKSIPSDAETFARFDVFLLGDIDSTYWKQPQMALLAQRVKDGAGFLMIGGYHSLGPGGYGGTAMEGILPVLVGSRDIGQITDPFLPVLTPDGRAHPIFANIAKFFPTAGGGEPELGGLPPLEGCVKVLGPKPTATVLATDPAAPGAPIPVLAVQPAGKGRAAVFTGDTTRNWQQAPRALNQESPFTRFWGQIVRWLANRSEPIKAEAGVTAHTDKAYYEPDSPVTIVAVVRDRQGEGTDQAQVSARVSGPQGAGEAVSLSPVPGSTGTYRGTFEPKRPGAFEIAVEARLAEDTLHADKVAVDVGRPNLEFDRLDLDDKRLAAIASATGGKYNHISTADRLLDDLNRQEQKRRVTYETPLYWPRLFWPVFVAVLTAEWVLRKRDQLR